MQLGVSFSTLLATLIISLFVLDDVAAAPYKRGPVPGSVTLKLRSVPPRNDIHPELRLQQHINRGLRRYAHMTKREVPTDDELRALLHKRSKRMYIPETGPGSFSSPEKRYNRQGVSAVAADFNAEDNSLAKSGKAAAAAGANGPTAADIVNAIMQNLKAGNGDVVGTNAGAANGAAAQANGTANGTATGTASAAAGSGTGIAQADIDAAQNGGLTNATTPTTADSLGLNIEANDVGYVADVQIGSQNTTFPVLMDSGSADFWVGAENCQEAQQQANKRELISKRDPKGGNGNGDANGNANNGGAAAAAAGGNQANTCGANHVFLGTGTSSTFKQSQQTFQTTYGSGAVAGNIVQDDVNMGGLALPAHTFGVATQETVQFADPSVAFSGLMGLAQGTLAEQKVPTPVEALATAGTIPAAITSFKLGRVADGNNDGEVTIGSLDTSKFNQQTLTTVPNVNTEGFWEGAMDAVTVDGQDLGLQGRTAILDTGTTLMIVPPNDAAAIHAQIPGSQSDGQGGFLIPCTTTSSVALTFGGTSFAIDPRDLLFAPVNANDPTGTCQSGISSGQIGAATEWLVGDVFLKNVYFSTDEGKNTVSLAQLA